MSRRNGSPECIPNYRLRRDELENYLNGIFPTMWVHARVSLISRPWSCAPLPPFPPPVAMNSRSSQRLITRFLGRVFSGSRGLLHRRLASKTEPGMSGFSDLTLPLVTRPKSEGDALRVLRRRRDFTLGERYVWQRRDIAHATAWILHGRQRHHGHDASLAQQHWMGVWDGKEGGSPGAGQGFL